MSWISREAMHRVLQSLIAAELHQARKGQASSQRTTLGNAVWPESLALGEAGTPALGCDSIELLWLAAAVNEMFCLYDTHVESSLLAARTLGDWLDIIERGWNDSGRRITFSTSGSEGVPKRCTHEVSNLQREIEFLAERFAGTKRVVALTPSHHIYGFLFTAMLPARLAVPVLGAETASPATLSRELAHGDLVISIPPRWEWLARSLSNWPGGIEGVTSTAPCPEPLKQALLDSGLQKLTEIYGSSETAGVGIRTFPEPRYTLMPFWHWTDRDEGSAKLRDNLGHQVTLQDCVAIAEDSTFVVQKRVDGAVQIGGVNVHPNRIEALLCSLPGVAQAAVRLSTDPGRERLKAFVVPDQTVAQPTLAQTLEQWTGTFSAPERVRSFTFGTELPRNSVGKLTNWVDAESPGSPF